MGQKHSKSKSSANIQSTSKDSIDHRQILQDLDVNTVLKVPFSQEIMLARIIDVYDADTVTVVFLCGNVPIRMKIRVKGIDAPEIRTKQDFEKQAALKAKQHVSDLLLNKIKYIKLDSHDKYGGRMVGDVYLNDKSECLSAYLLQRGYVKAYDGGKKSVWTKAECQKIINGK